MSAKIDNILHSHLLIKEVYLKSDDLDRQVLAKFSLSPVSYYLLNHLVEQGSISPSRLCQLLLYDSANLSRLLDRLEKEGLVESMRHDTTGRRIFVSISSSGRQLWEQANRDLITSIRSRYNSFSLEQTADLNSLLEILLESLDKNLPK